MRRFRAEREIPVYTKAKKVSPSSVRAHIVSFHFFKTLQRRKMMSKLMFVVGLVCLCATVALPQNASQVVPARDNGATAECGGPLRSAPRFAVWLSATKTVPVTD